MNYPKSETFLTDAQLHEHERESIAATFRRSEPAARDFAVDVPRRRVAVCATAEVEDAHGTLILVDGVETPPAWLRFTPALLDHDPRQHVGRVLTWRRSAPAGGPKRLLAVVEVFAGTAGDDVLRRAASGSLGASCGLLVQRARKFAGAVEVVASSVRELSFTSLPSNGGAWVLSGGELRGELRGLLGATPTLDEIGALCKRAVAAFEARAASRRAARRPTPTIDRRAVARRSPAIDPFAVVRRPRRP